jgi:hypothetical protein
VGPPDRLYYFADYPIGTIYLYPVPAQIYTITLDSWKALPELTTLTAEINLPPEYLNPLRKSLAAQMAYEYGRMDVYPGLAIEAEKSMTSLKRFHSYPVKETKHELATRQTWDINNG